MIRRGTKGEEVSCQYKSDPFWSRPPRGAPTAAAVEALAPRNTCFYAQIWLTPWPQNQDHCRGRMPSHTKIDPHRRVPSPSYDDCHAQIIEKYAFYAPAQREETLPNREKEEMPIHTYTHPCILRQGHVCVCEMCVWQQRNQWNQVWLFFLPPDMKRDGSSCWTDDEEAQRTNPPGWWCHHLSRAPRLPVAFLSK